MPKENRTVTLWLLACLMLLSLIGVARNVGPRAKPPGEIGYSDMLAEVDGGRVRVAVLRGHLVIGQMGNGDIFRSYLPDDPSLAGRLVDKGVTVIAVPEVPAEGDYSDIGLMVIGGVTLATLVLVAARRNALGNRFMDTRKSRARDVVPGGRRVTFADVAGIDEARDELAEIVSFLKDPDRFGALGGRVPRGILLCGPPGTGKTLLARAIAGEAGVPFMETSGSEFVEMFVGVGASRARDLFKRAAAQAPCILFIDEVDAVGRKRGVGTGGGNDEREQTLNQILVEMDGIETGSGVIVVAATNRPDVLDPALLRPGRFDRQVEVPNPDVRGRSKILQVHLRRVLVGDGIDTQALARATPGLSGADLANIVNEAALSSARLGKPDVGMAELRAAVDKELLGAERRSLVISPRELRMTAYHEAGHAILAVLDPECDPVHKATIVPRGRALGLVASLPAEDRNSETKGRLLARLRMAMGGRVAEELVFGPGNVSNGASGDIRQATRIATAMVTEWGMGESGMVAWSGGMTGWRGTPGLSQHTARELENEIRAVVDAAYASAAAILKSRIGTLHALAAALLEHETLSGDEVRSAVLGDA